MSDTRGRALCAICKSSVLKKFSSCTNCQQVLHNGCSRRKCCEKPQLNRQTREETSLEESDEEEGNTSTYRKKRSRVDPHPINVTDTSLEDLWHKIGEMNDVMVEMRDNLNMLIIENRELRKEIIAIRSDKEDTAKQIGETNRQKTSYANIVSNNNNKVLIVNPSGSNDTGRNKNSCKKLKNDLRTKLNPVDIGVNFSISNETKSGGLILQCVDAKNDEEIQNKIQEKLGSNYKVESKEHYKNRLKILWVDESEFETSNEDLITKITKQNGLDSAKSEIKLVFKSKVKNKKFNIILEVNTYSYEHLITKEKLYMGWSRCRVIEDYGVVRCYNCQRYGHLAGDCSNKLCCPICAGSHLVKNCNSERKQCTNCLEAISKYHLTLDTAHEVWNSDCAVLRRQVKAQKIKFVASI